MPATPDPTPPEHPPRDLPAVLSYLPKPRPRRSPGPGKRSADCLLMSLLFVMAPPVSFGLAIASIVFAFQAMQLPKAKEDDSLVMGLISAVIMLLISGTTTALFIYLLLR